MASDAAKTETFIQDLIRLTQEIARGSYDQSAQVFEFTKTGQYPPLISELAESLGMMMVKIEAREYQLERMIEDLNQKNQQLQAALRKVALLEKVKAHLGKFVPESVKRIIETAPDAPHLEKRQSDVSVLFLDIAGYTRLSESVDSEKVNFLIERYFSSFMDDIYNNRGDINETAGDGLMIIFQEPDEKEHALNAVRTALGIRGRVERINKDLQGEYDPIAVNIGINSGSALVGSSRFQGVDGARWTFTASGPVTNVAARIGKLATRGEILVGEDTASRVRDHFEMDDLGFQRFKNVEAPVRVFHVLGPREGR